ncbi:hypothetical protein PMAYCL1PPCAC_31652, partial [Pristionchus mayeri]
RHACHSLGAAFPYAPPTYRVRLCLWPHQSQSPDTKQPSSRCALMKEAHRNISALLPRCSSLPMDQHSQRRSAAS